MKAVVFHSYGSPDVLQMVDLPRPTITAEQVLVKVESFGINPKDAMIRSGALRWLSGRRFPKQTGFDLSGTVVEVGEAVTDLLVGDLVFGYLANFEGGAAAEEVAVPAAWVARRPASISPALAAAMPCTYLTALQALRDKARLQPGQHVVIYGASGGVGTAAIQLAKRFGATVTSVSSARNVDHCLANGADLALAYDQDNIFAASKQCDVFFQVFAAEGSLYGKARIVLKNRGVFVTVIPNPMFELRGVLNMALSLPRLRTVTVKSNRADLELLAQLAERGVIHPRIDRELSIDDIAQAHRLIETQHVRGKIVLQVVPADRP
jgi:NADPH:quinone reductase-like Zn-dependent oxidoreductase